MQEVYPHINALSKEVYRRWGDEVSFDFASFAQDNDEKPFRITWTIGDQAIQRTVNGGKNLRPLYRFELVRYLQSEESNLHQFFVDFDIFVSLIANDGYDVVNAAAIDTATPNRVAMIVEAFR